MGTSACRYNDVFIEKGITTVQCSTLGTAPFTCYPNNECLYNFLSSSSMTVEMCLIICSSTGFIYTAITS